MKNNRWNWKGIGLIVAITLGLLIGPISTVIASDSNAKVFPPDSVIHGRTYGDWSAAWWQWALSIPVATHPLFDNGDCSVGQSGPVWFLGGKFCRSDLPPGETCIFKTERNCTVPAGKALYFPVLNAEDSLVEEQAFQGAEVFVTIAELRHNVESWLDTVNKVSVVLDGYSFRSLKRQFRMQSTVFGITIPEDNLFTAIGEGTFSKGAYFPVVDEGYYLMLKPLQPGNHKLHFKGLWGNFSLDITYHLKVE